MARKLAVAVSGTPGTGKSTFARELSKRLRSKLIDLDALIEEAGIYELDNDGTRIADPEDVHREFARVTAKVSDPLVEVGLLAHLLPEEELTHVVVLRTRPAILEERLEERGYTGEKLKDNLEAEALGIILWEAVEAHGADRVYEIDTTEVDVSNAAGLFLCALKGEVSLRPGKIDWLEEFYEG